MKGKPAVSSSKKAMGRFMKLMDGADSLVSRSKTSSHLVGQSNTTKIVCISCNKLKCLSFLRLKRMVAEETNVDPAVFPGEEKESAKPHTLISTTYTLSISLQKSKNS